MDLNDALLMIMVESGDHPALAALARSAHEQLGGDGVVDYRLLSDVVAEASGKGVLRAINAEHGPVTRDAIFGPILREIDRQ